ncbi:MAG: hypothetical protein JXA67_11505 [Micromonosporaceae bacterium]|nr:hypothetical protein [Micromonosporaceae bacterium]
MFQPPGAVLEGTWAVADKLGLSGWWLNEQASVYGTPGSDHEAPRLFDHAGLRVSAALPEHLLAMKVLAARRRRQSTTGLGGRLPSRRDVAAPRDWAPRYPPSAWPPGGVAVVSLSQRESDVALWINESRSVSGAPPRLG